MLLNFFCLDENLARVASLYAQALFCVDPWTNSVVFRPGQDFQVFLAVLSIEENCTYLFFSLFSLFFPLLFLSSAPLAPHPPLRLARRPNRGHIGGGPGTPPAVHAFDVFIARGFQHFHPRQP